MISAIYTLLLSGIIVILAASLLTVIDWMDRHWERIKSMIHCRKRMNFWKNSASDEPDDIAKAYKTALYFHYVNQLEVLRKNPPESSDGETDK